MARNDRTIRGDGTMGTRHWPVNPGESFGERRAWRPILSIALALALALSMSPSPTSQALADEQQAEEQATAGSQPAPESQEAIESGGITEKMGSPDGSDTAEGQGIVDEEALEASPDDSLDEGIALSESGEAEFSLSEIAPVTALATEQQKRDAYAKGSLGFFEWLGAPGAAAATIVKDTGSHVPATTTIGRVYDATSLENMKASIAWLKKCNQLRAAEGTDPRTGTPLQPLKVNLQLMAIAQVQANWSAEYRKHSEMYAVGENLAWGYPDPFKGWYDEEKAIYQAGSSGTTGHYLNIVTANYATTGFAVNQYGAYGVTHGQTFSGQEPGDTLSVEDFETLFNAYYNGVKPSKSEKELSGSTRIGTAISIARETYPAGPKGVIIAKSGDFPDALAASSLAGAKGYPILLCSTDKLDAELSSYLKGLGGTLTEAILIGDSNSLSEKGVKAALTKFVPSVQRIGGKSRFETAQLLRAEARKAGAPGTTAVIARSNNFPDALSISPYCAADGALMYLVEPGATLDEGMRAELSGCSRIIIVGDKNSVSSKVESALSGTSAEVIRLAGGVNNPYPQTRYGTSAAIVQWLTHPGGAGFNGGTVTFATGQKFPDALAGGPLCGASRTPLVLVDASDYSAVVNVPAAKQLYWLGSKDTLSARLRTTVKNQLGY